MSVVQENARLIGNGWAEEAIDYRCIVGVDLNTDLTEIDGSGEADNGMIGVTFDVYTCGCLRSVPSDPLVY
jgi:hypothetical protein